MSILYRIPLGSFLPKSCPPKQERVLLVRDDMIGDIVVPTSAVIKWLHEQGLDTYLVLRKELVDIGKLMLPAANLIPLDIKLYRSSLKYRYSFLKDLREIGFSLTIGSLIHSSVNDDIVRNSGAGSRWGYKRNHSLKEDFRLRGIRKVGSLPLQEDARERYNSVVEHERHFLETIFHTKIEASGFGPFVKLQPAATPELPERYIHYLAEAGAVRRVFPVERLLPILTSIASKAGLKVVLTGLKKIAVNDELCVNLTGETTLEEVINIVGKAEFVVGNESGLTHLAWLLGKKTAMFYGGGHWGRFEPTPEVLLLNQDCDSKCCDWKCRYTSIPVPCVNLDDAEVFRMLEGFILGAEVEYKRI